MILCWVLKVLGNKKAVTQSYSVKNVFLKISQNSQKKNLRQNLFFNKVAGATCNFIKKEALSQVFSCEFCEIFKNSFFYRTPPLAASGIKEYK